LRPDGRAPARDGTPIVAPDGAPVGVVTSGGFGPSVGAPIAMGFVERGHAAPGTPVGLVVRGKPLPARVAPLPFHPHAYYRG
jgi:aminomethyltransferase